MCVDVTLVHLLNKQFTCSHFKGILEGDVEKVRMIVHPCCMISNWNGEMAEMRSLSRDAWLNVIHSSSSQSKEQTNRFEVLSIEIISESLAMCQIKYDCGVNSMIDMLYLKKERTCGDFDDKNSHKWIILQKMLISISDTANERVSKGKYEFQSSSEDVDKENRAYSSTPHHNHDRKVLMGPSQSKPIDFRSSSLSPKSNPPLLQICMTDPKITGGDNKINKMYRTDQMGASCTPLSSTTLSAMRNTTSALISTPDFTDI